MTVALPRVPLREAARPVARAVPVSVGELYRQLGVRLWGLGAYEREPVDGGMTKYQQLYRAERGDIVVNKIWARNGSVAVIDEMHSGCHGSGEFPMFTLLPERIDPRWMHWVTKSREFWAQCDEKSQGTSGKNRIKPERFLDVEIPLPPLDEQRRIVARIKELAAKVEEARRLRDQNAKGADALTTSGAAAALEALTGNSPRRPLGSLVSVRGGGTPSKDAPHYWGGSIPWITPKDMKRRALTDAIDHITSLAAKESPAKLLEPGAVLVVVRGMILAHTFPAAVLLAAATINQDMKALIPDASVLPEYLCSVLWAWNPHVLALVDRSGHDTRKLNTDKLLALEIPVPTVKVQKRLIEELNALQSKIEVVKKVQTETVAELNAMLPAILDKAFKGEL